MARDSSASRPSLDWTQDAEPPSEYCRFVRNYDFASTTLGPIEEWPTLLRQAVCQIMVHPHPRVLAWGPELCYLYNESARTLTIRHGRQDCLGQPANLLWPDIIEAGLGTQYDQVMQTGAAINTPRMLLLLDGPAMPSPSSGETATFSKVECYLGLTLTPVLDANGHVLGIMHDYVDITPSVLANRRLAAIEEIERGLSKPPPTTDIWSAIMKPLEKLSADVPFAVAFSIMPDLLSQMPLHQRLVFEESIGIGINHPISDELRQDKRIFDLLEGAWYADMHSFTPGQPPQCRDETHDRCALHLAQNNLAPSHITHMSDEYVTEEINGTLHSCNSVPRGLDELLQLREPFIVPGRGFDAPVLKVLVIIIPKQNPPDPFGVLILGMNNRSPYDKDYQCFTNLLKSIIINNITSIVYPRVVRRVTDNLLQRAQQHERVEVLFKALGISAPFGLAFWTRTEGATYTPTWNNAAWNDLFSIKEGENPTVDMENEANGLHMERWLIHIHPEDHHILQTNWQALIDGSTAGNMQFRVLRKHYSNNNESMYRWVLVQSSHHYHVHSGLHSLGAWAIDITTQKTHELHQAQRVEDALEQKRQSEHFIDMVSHELRNPMSAMLQSTDLIVSTARDMNEFARDTPENVRSLCSTILDAAEVISLCTQHQKRIVDDVLTLSKLDANLLIVVPEPVQVPPLLEQLNRIYDAELKAAGIKSAVHLDDSYDAMQLGEVMRDPGRLLQVLMNIFTNAQKFTRDVHRMRRIDFHLGASFTRPEYGPLGAEYVPFRNEGLLKNDEQRADKNMRENTQETIFLTFSIADTGRGMHSGELKQLFKKFSQASPKTYGKYGGSGLGLFITRDLVELQGGQIGVTSKEDHGTIFFFYIKVERVVIGRRGSSLPRKASLTELLSEFKRRKGDVGRATTELRERGSASPSPNDEKTSVQGPTLKTPTYEFDSPHMPGHFRAKHGPTYVLLVEDNLINQRILAQQLRKEGCSVATADNGLEAIQYVKQSCFASWPEASSIPESEDCSPGASPRIRKGTDRTLVFPKPLTLVLMDIEMPIMNGLDATSRIRDFEKDGTIIGHLPIIAVTANARPEHIRKAYDAGMDDVLTKPFRISQLLEKIKDNIERLAPKMNGSEGLVPF